MSIGYLLAKPLQFCPDDQLVKTLRACKLSALASVQAEYPGARFGISTDHSDRPKGCYFSLSTEKLYFNTHNTGKLDHDLLQVCQKGT